VQLVQVALQAAQESQVAWAWVQLLQSQEHRLGTLVQVVQLAQAAVEATQQVVVQESWAWVQ
jgi:hypothetical protein